ncbi:AAA family ATPase [Elizabethkingia anophelis]|jgi:predicted ATPase|uniref:AAA family ATPase n=1 Tax=Elizabethkingia anophelis TaxID=1117645 RepID=UPI0021A2ABB7|nr:AAA family ATPase [Elizabethkingia anophelis]MDV4069996.1 ATPase [Elizabethkingia anophelis]
MEEIKLFVITGGPGVGKTTLLNELEKQGNSIVPEEARKIIQEQVKINGKGLPWENKVYYAQLMMEASIQTYLRIVSHSSFKITFFDRGILDTICYMNMENLQVSEEMNTLASIHKYNRKIFILPPWDEIYETDNERKQTWEEAVYTFDKMKQTYLEFGYDLIEVPKGNVDYRCEFVMKHIP